MNNSQKNRVKAILDEKEKLYNCRDFIANDPVSIPHSFNLKQDIEIMGLFASLFAWGQRPVIIKKCRELALRLNNSPYKFVTEHKESDLKCLLGFKHRTFNEEDLLYSIDFLKRHYSCSETLEDAFTPAGEQGINVEKALIHFYNYFFDQPYAPRRTRKHISTPVKKSACKRLNMFLRWMVRKDDRGVDFGLWNRIDQKDLICPLDLHVERTARKLGLITRKNADWQAAIELTENLKQFDPDDPVKYDFALFGISIEENGIIL